MKIAHEAWFIGLGNSLNFIAVIFFCCLATWQKIFLNHFHENCDKQNSKARGWIGARTVAMKAGKFNDFLNIQFLHQFVVLFKNSDPHYKSNALIHSTICLFTPKQQLQSCCSWNHFCAHLILISAILYMFIFYTLCGSPHELLLPMLFFRLPQRHVQCPLEFYLKNSHLDVLNIMCGII